MKAPDLTRWTRKCLAATLGAVLTTSCAVSEGPYGLNTQVRIGVDYYDPWIDNYNGGWPAGYGVAPYPYGYGRGTPRPLPQHQPRGHRAAGPDRPMPSLPTHSHVPRPPGSGH